MNTGQFVFPRHNLHVHCMLIIIFILLCYNGLLLIEQCSLGTGRFVVWFQGYCRHTRLQFGLQITNCAANINMRTIQINSKTSNVQSFLPNGHVPRSASERSLQQIAEQFRVLLTHINIKTKHFFNTGFFQSAYPQSSSLGLSSQ